MNSIKREHVQTSIEALRESGAPSMAETFQQLLQDYDALHARVQELESAESCLIAERDHRDEIIDRMADAVLGSDRHEWTSAYDFVDAAQEVEDRMSVLIEMEKQAAFPIEGGSNG